MGDANWHDTANKDNHHLLEEPLGCLYGSNDWGSATITFLASPTGFVRITELNSE